MRTTSSAVPPTKNNVKRTKSYEPAWWGNVLAVQDGTSLHSHATPASASPASAAVAAASPNISHANTASKKQRSFFPPVHTLILGTHPSAASLDRNEMFGHPQNAFWYIAGDALGFRRSAAISAATGRPYSSYHDYLRYGPDEIIDYPQQLERLVSRGFAIWDIVAECEREGSLDNDIKGEIPNPIREFCEGATTTTDDDDQLLLCIRRIVIANGTTGGQMFVKHFASWFMEGKLRPAEDELSQRVLGAVTNRSKKLRNGSAKEEDDAPNQHSIEVVCLPSVSPAAASITYLEKREAWKRAAIIQDWRTISNGINPKLGGRTCVKELWT